MITNADVAELMGRWWCSYDEGEMEVLHGLLGDDAHFTCRTDTGTAAWEEFVRADLRGRDAVMAWHTEHRMASPYPLRHNGTNLHLTDRAADAASFRSYIAVAHIVDGLPMLISTGTAKGRVLQQDDTLRLAELHMVLDTMTSVPFSQRETS